MSEVSSAIGTAISGRIGAEVGIAVSENLEKKAARKQSEDKIICTDEYIPLIKQKGLWGAFLLAILIVFIGAIILLGVFLLLAAIKVILNFDSSNNVNQLAGNTNYGDVIVGGTLGIVIILVMWPVFLQNIRFIGSVKFSKEGIIVKRFGKMYKFAWSELEDIVYLGRMSYIALVFSGGYEVPISFWYHGNLFDMLACAYLANLNRPKIVDRIEAIIYKYVGFDGVKKLRNLTNQFRPAL